MKAQKNLEFLYRCEAIQEIFGFMENPLSAEEKDFPIAYTIEANYSLLQVRRKKFGKIFLSILLI